jgi:hypothetical protein
MESSTLGRVTGRAGSEENIEVVGAASQARNARDTDAFHELRDFDVILRPAKLA